MILLKLGVPDEAILTCVTCTLLLKIGVRGGREEEGGGGRGREREREKFT